MDLTAAFDRFPTATLGMFLGDMGHGYAKAKWSSRCKLTGLDIRLGEAVRKITVHTPQGLTWTGYTANRIVSILFTEGRAGVTTLDRDEVHLSSLGKCRGDWVSKVEDAISNPQDRLQVHVVTSTGLTKGWTYQSWSGKWQSHTSTAQVSAAQLVSSLRRGKSNRLWRVRNNGSVWWKHQLCGSQNRQW